MTSMTDEKGNKGRRVGVIGKYGALEFAADFLAVVEENNKKEKSGGNPVFKSTSPSC